MHYLQKLYRDVRFVYLLTIIYVKNYFYYLLQLYLDNVLEVILVAFPAAEFSSLDNKIRSTMV